MTSSRLIDALAATDALADAFSDRAILKAMLEFEQALARAAASAGAIPGGVAEALAAVRVEEFDPLALARDARRSATPSIPFVDALVDLVRQRDPESASWVHWAATSQDLSDTALMLVLRQARGAIRADHERLAASLRGLADAHASTVMLGRTLLQPAAPITFGLKAAGWWAAVSRSWSRVNQAWDAALVLQFGGAAGTRAAAGPHGAVVARLLAAELALADGPPWHTDRDRLGALVSACGLYTAALGKVARDVSLLMQSEVGEVSEAGGGSSSMPHKRNPAGCTIALAAAARMPGLVSAMLNSMAQEHERSTGGSQAEWPTISAVVQSTGSAAQAMADVFDGLTIDPDRMRRNLEATRGSIFAERAMTMLRPVVGRDAARTLVTQALQQSRATGRSFGEALSALPEAASALTPDALRDLEVPERYLGEAEEIRKRLLEAAGSRKPEAQAGGRKPEAGS